MHDTPDSHPIVPEPCQDGSSTDLILEGSILSIGTTEARVLVAASTSCGSCALKGGCAGNSVRQREISVALVPGMSPGQRVRLSLSSGKEAGAAILLFAVPVLILVISTVVLLDFGLEATTAGLSALGLLALWFLVLYGYRHTLGRRFAWRAELLDGEGAARKESHESDN